MLGCALPTVQPSTSTYPAISDEHGLCPWTEKASARGAGSRHGRKCKRCVATRKGEMARWTTGKRKKIKEKRCYIDKWVPPFIRE